MRSENTVCLFSTQNEGRTFFRTLRLFPKSYLCSLIGILILDRMASRFYRNFWLPSRVGGGKEDTELLVLEICHETLNGEVQGSCNPHWNWNIRWLNNLSWSSYTWSVTTVLNVMCTYQTSMNKILVSNMKKQIMRIVNLFNLSSMLTFPECYLKSHTCYISEGGCFPNVDNS